MKKILITTGGSGGHVVPAEIIADHLKDIFEINYSTDLRGYQYFKSHKDKTIIIDTPKLNLNFLIPVKLIKLFYLIIKSTLYLKKKKIIKIISTGGYMSLPVCISAKILGLKIYLLEPNLTLGRGNKFFLNFSEKIICYSKEIKNFPKKFIHKIEIIKPLVAKNFYKKNKIDHANKDFCFLIVGGSQGAKIFDDLIKNIIIDLSKKYSVSVIQQTSTYNFKYLKKFYDENKIKNKIFNFEKNFKDLIEESDLCITRAGATSLAEIAIMNKPFVAIPLPSSKDNHQMENAKFYEKAGCCWILDQKNIDIDREILANILSNILKDKSNYINKKINLKKLNYHNLWNDVNQKIKKIIDEN